MDLRFVFKKLRRFSLGASLVMGLVLGHFGADARAAEPIHIVFDLDWTLFSTLPNDFPIPAGEEGKRYFKIGDGTFRMMDGVEDTLRNLLRYPHVKISFFSGGDRGRIEQLLKEIVIDREPKRTAFDIAEKILAYEDLDDLYRNIPVPKGVRFTDRYRKNIVRHFGDSGRAFLVDDISKFVYPEQKKMLFPVRGTYDFYRNFSDTYPLRAAGKTTNFTPPTFEAWELNRARIPIVGLKIEDAIQADLAEGGDGKGRPFLDRLEEFSNRPRIEYRNRLNFALIRKIHECPALLKHFTLTPR